MKIVFAICLVMLMETFAATASLADWVGKYPRNESRDYRNFFELDSVKKPVMTMLTPQQWKLLTQTYAVMSPIELIEGHLTITVCKPHCCPCEHAILVVNLKSSEFHTGFYEWDGVKTKIEWVSSSHHTFEELPASVLKEFYHGHVPK